MSLKLTELPYLRDSSELFCRIAAEPWSIFLDSGFPHIDSGRYDIIAARPYKTITSQGVTSTVTDQSGECYTTDEDPFSLLQSLLGEKDRNMTGLPFCGGAMGYFAYDLGRRIERLPETSAHDVQLPDMAIGLYDWVVIVDHHQRKSALVSYGRNENTFAIWNDLLALFQGECHIKADHFEPLSDIHSNLDKEAYSKAFDRIKYYIREGDCYQVNLAQRFSIEVSGDPWDAYCRLRKLNPAPFAAYFNLPDSGAVLSSSPERFLRVTNGLVETKPIKGTRRRSAYPYEDKSLAVELLESEKDRAENLMIVDLLRNDIGKTCISGTVSVPQLFALESYATVHHLVSTITGQIKPDKHALDLFRGCFPGGSITGAPKLRAMEIIEELEPHRRNIYCGSLGYIGFDGNMDSNITIRTLLHFENYMYCWAGGGIVHDSVMEAEYQECYDKAAALLHLLEKRKIKNVVN